MDLSTQPLFQSPTADRLLFARDLRADRATLVSGHWNSLPISASLPRNHRRFSRRRGLATNEQDGSAYSNLGARALRRQPGFPYGFRLSRKHRSSDGVAVGLRRLDVSPKSTGARGPAFVQSLAYTWLVFFVFAPGVCPQYLIWLAPFILILSPTFYSCMLVASSAFLFAFYNITSGGLPWSVALSTDEVRERWISWSLLPWIVLIIGPIALWRRAQMLRIVQTRPSGASSAAGIVRLGTRRSALPLDFSDTSSPCS